MTMTKTFLLGGIAALGMATIAIAQPAPAPGMQHGMGNAATKVQTRAEVSAHVQTMFARLDADRDGFVTKAEGEAARTSHHQAMRGAGHSAPEARGERPAHDRGAMFDRLDSNKDGAISREEFAAAPARANHARKGAKMAKMHKRMHGMGMGMGGHRFAMADGNNDGRVSMKEATDAAFKHFDMADTNRDGRIVPEERQQMRQRMMKNHRTTKSS